jgi:hypothetical protein
VMGPGREVELQVAPRRSAGGIRIGPRVVLKVLLKYSGFPGAEAENETRLPGGPVTCRSIGWSPIEGSAFRRPSEIRSAHMSHDNGCIEGSGADKERTRG